MSSFLQALDFIYLETKFGQNLDKKLLKHLKHAYSDISVIVDKNVRKGKNCDFFPLYDILCAWSEKENDTIIQVVITVAEALFLFSQLLSSHVKPKFQNKCADNSPYTHWR